eukprot:TRINITY_DN736_c0_g2_i5.p1 TRINITY_DN736_c0_g2~~TRINITY_DN736_c0_g2_i5.p1  ORF type:complete len:562 (-),score=126.73 TRINITY_DN736_c0_g2_i5:57-1742(-)
MANVDQSIKDKAWENVQIKAFTHWVNTTLEKRGKKITSLAEAFADGLTIIHFLELLTEKKLKQKYALKPVMRIALIENTHLALQFLRSCGLEAKFLTVQSEDLVDKNLKLLLGFLWTLFRKYRIAIIEGAEGKSTEEGLLMWCRQVTQGYDGVNIADFSHSFNDGLAFLAMIDKFDGNILDYAAEKNKSIEQRIDDAFNFAETQLGVPKLLDAQDLLNGSVDERSVVLYVSLYFHAFVSNEDKKKEREAREAEYLKSKSLATEEIDSLKAELESTRSENQDLKHKLKHLKSDHQDLNGKYTHLSEEFSKIKGGLSSTSTENDSMKLKLDGLSKETQELQEKYSKAQKQLKERDEKIALLEKQTSELTETKGILESQLKETKEDFQKRIVEKEERVESLEGEVEALTKEKEHLEDELREWKMKYNKLQEKLVEQDKLQILGLDALRKNLIEHVNDMNVWKDFLEQDREYASETIIKRSENEISSRPAEDQLSFMVDALESENRKLQVLLKQREIEEGATEKAPPTTTTSSSAKRVSTTPTKSDASSKEKSQKDKRDKRTNKK